MAGTSSPEAVKKLLENMQGDLRALSLECRKKFPPVKEVSGTWRGDVSTRRTKHHRNKRQKPPGSFPRLQKGTGVPD
ncbi:Protein MON2-like protein, partial [Ophiophagus hannah]